MSVLFIGKRFYTNRDALRERYGRIYQLPWYWAKAGISTRLWLVDYHSGQTSSKRNGALKVVSTPVRNLALFREWLTGAYASEGKPHVVVASGDCYIGWLGWRIARRLRARFVFDVYDRYDEFAGYRRLFGFDLFAHLLQNADVRLFASRTLLDELGRPGIDCLVPNGVDTLRFVPRDMRTSRGAMNLPQDALLVGYFGSMEPDRGVSDLVNAVLLLRQKGMNVQLVLGGKLAPGVAVGQTGVIYLGNVAYDRVPDALAACDLLAVPYRRSQFMDAGASNKIAEAIACSKPIVATRTPNLTANFSTQAAQLGPLLAEPSDPASLARSIRSQAEQRLRVDMPPGMSWREIAADVAPRLALADTDRNISSHTTS